ncbi:MAG: enoyl-CoA hydratase/isomerase family protein [Deltaproteobacteria bacterium]|nr:enoyl-CoA hydratase/isomerase family protein [Deltaproteobacteria bacterium]
MQYTTILFEVKNRVARITLNRPEAANALNLDMGKDLMHAAVQCSEDPNIGAVIITGAGRMFSGGGDLKSFAAQGEHMPAHLKEVTTYFHAAVSRFTRMDAPVIAAVNGTAAGAGLSMVCSCDLVLAAESAKFTMAYTRIGLTPDGSSTYFLPRIVGLKRALELTLTNRLFSAQEAQEWGIVTKVVPDANLQAEADALAAQLASSATGALGAAKRLLHSGWNETLETQMELETQTIAARAHSADGREGITAFLEKRAPQFKGQ